MIYDVVLTVKHTLSVPARFKTIGKYFFRKFFVRQHVERPLVFFPVSLPRVYVYSFRAVRASIDVFTVKTPVACTVGLIFLLKIGQIAARIYIPRFRTGKILQQIEIVATFCHYHRRRILSVAPIPPDVTVRVMPVRDLLQIVYRYKPTYRAAVQYLF